MTIDFSEGLPLEEPRTVIPWLVTADELVQQFPDARLSQVGSIWTYVLRGQVEELGEVRIGVETSDDRPSVLRRLSGRHRPPGSVSFSIQEPDGVPFQEAYSAFRAGLKKLLGPPTQTELPNDSNDGFEFNYWFRGDVVVTHGALERFVPSQILRIERGPT